MARGASRSPRRDVYVANNVSGTVSKIVGNTVTATITVGNGRGASRSPRRHRLRHQLLRLQRVEKSSVTWSPPPSGRHAADRNRGGIGRHRVCRRALLLLNVISPLTPALATHPSGHPTPETRRQPPTPNPQRTTSAGAPHHGQPTQEALITPATNQRRAPLETLIQRRHMRPWLELPRAPKCVSHNMIQATPHIPLQAGKAWPQTIRK